MSFRVGQKVVCVKGAGIATKGEVVPLVGEIYTIREVRERTNGVRLREIVNKAFQYSNTFGEVWFWAGLFRPVDETFGEEVAERVESLLQEEPEKQTIEI